MGDLIFWKEKDGLDWCWLNWSRATAMKYAGVVTHPCHHNCQLSFIFRYLQNAHNSHKMSIGVFSLYVLNSPFFTICICIWNKSIFSSVWIKAMNTSWMLVYWYTFRQSCVFPSVFVTYKLFVILGLVFVMYLHLYFHMGWALDGWWYCHYCHSTVTATNLSCHSYATTHVTIANNNCIPFFWLRQELFTL